jgi:hypothetical protein
MAHGRDAGDSGKRRKIGQAVRRGGHEDGVQNYRRIPDDRNVFGFELVAKIGVRLHQALPISGGLNAGHRLARSESGGQRRIGQHDDILPLGRLREYGAGESRHTRDPSE